MSQGQEGQREDGQHQPRHPNAKAEVSDPPKQLPALKFLIFLTLLLHYKYPLGPALASQASRRGFLLQLGQTLWLYFSES